MLELRGKKVSDGIKEYVSKELETLSFVPKIAIVRVGENLGLDTGAIRQEYERIRAELEKVGLFGCIDQKIKELSFGMRQRVALVRAFYADWDVLFLDEPFRGLDKSTRELVMEYTKRKCSGKQVLFITHDEEEKKLVIGK